MTQRQSLQGYLTSIGFMLAYIIPAVPIVSIWLGKTTQHPNVFAALPLLITYGLTPLLELVFPYGIKPIPDPISWTKGWQFYYRCLLWLSFPLQLGMLYITLDYWNSTPFSIWGAVVYLLSVGTYSGMFAITVAHELIHHHHPSDQAMGGLLLSTVGFGTFKIVHLRIHHRYVCTPLDFATAQRGQSIYAFWWKNLTSNITEAIRCERNEHARTDRVWWRSELLLWSLLSLLWLSIAVLIGGGKGGVFWLLQSLIGILQLDLINYLQHYGLRRKRSADGRYESVNVHHAWSVGQVILDLALFNLLRHGEHHAHSQRLYPTLRHYDNGPQYPYSYTTMHLLALVPALFQRIVHPHLDRLESQQR